MEKTTLFVFYNLFMMSIYLGINFLRPFVLYSLSIIYISVILFINFNIYHVWKTEKIEKSNKIALLSWQYLWGIIIILFIGRDLGWVNDLGIISAFVLFLVLSFTTITSCYVILMDSRHWTTQMFMTASLHWILFHDNESWISSSMYVLSLPLFVMVLLRVIFYVETNEKPIQAVIEILFFILIIVFEISYDVKLITSQVLFGICIFGFMSIILVQNDKFTNVIVFCAPIALPFMYIFTLTNIYRLGWQIGLATTWNNITKKWRNVSGEEIKLLKILSQEGVLTFNDNQFDNTL